MAVYDSGLTVFKITDTGASLRDVSAFITQLDGLPGPRELNDATGLNKTGREFHPTLQNAPFTIEFMWSDDALVGPDTVFGPLRTHTSPTAFEYYPKGGASPKYSGNCWVRNWQITTRVGSLLVGRAECQVNGTVTRA